MRNRVLWCAKRRKQVHVADTCESWMPLGSATHRWCDFCALAEMRNRAEVLGLVREAEAAEPRQEALL